MGRPREARLARRGTTLRSWRRSFQKLPEPGAANVGHVHWLCDALHVLLVRRVVARGPALAQTSPLQIFGGEKTGERFRATGNGQVRMVLEPCTPSLRLQGRRLRLDALGS